MLSEAIMHVYKDIWVPIIGEILFCEQEPSGNEEDRFAVAGHQLSKYLGTFNLACLPNFRANNSQFPQGCRIIRVLKFSGIYGNLRNCCFKDDYPTEPW